MTYTAHHAEESRKRSFCATDAPFRGPFQRMNSPARQILRVIVLAFLIVAMAANAAELEWEGSGTSNHEGEWDDTGAWLDGGTAYTWQTDDTHDVNFVPKGTGWFTHIGVPAEGVTPGSVTVGGLSKASFELKTGDTGPATLETGVFDTAAPTEIASDVTLNASRVVVRGDSLRFANAGPAAYTGALELRGGAVSYKKGGTFNNAIDVHGHSSFTEFNYNGSSWDIAGNVNLNPGANFVISEASQQWRTYTLSGSVNVQGDAGIQGGTGDANKTRITGNVSGDHTVTLTATGGGSGLHVESGTWDVGGLTKAGGGELTLSTPVATSGETLVTAGKLNLNHLDALQNSVLDTGAAGSQSIAFTVPGDNTYNLGGLQGVDDLSLGGNRMSVGGKNASNEYSGVLSGSGGLTKVGGGELILSGANTYAGTTEITEGVLVVNGDQSDATGDVNVGGEATLGGTGTVGGHVSVEAGGTLAPGLSPGMLSLTGGLNNSGTIAVEIGGLTPGEDFDVLSVNGGDAILGGVLNVALLDEFQPANGAVFPVITTSEGGSLIDNGIALGGPAGSAFAMDLDPSTGVLNIISQVPEPTAALLIVLAGLGVLARRRF